MATRKTTFATIARNIRRQADTRLAQLESMAASAKNEFVRQGIQQRINLIQEAKEGTYINNASGKRIAGRTEADRRASLQKLASQLASTRYATAKGRRNLASTEMQLNLASVKEESSLFTEAEARIVYAATTNAWAREGISTSERNEAMLEYYGYESFSELVADILAINVKAVEKSKRRPKERLTEEQKEALGEGDVKEAQGSPDYLRDVIPMPEPSGLAELSKA